MHIREVTQSVWSGHSRSELKLDQFLERDHAITVSFHAGIRRVGERDRFGFAITRIFAGCQCLYFNASLGVQKTFFAPLNAGRYPFPTRRS